MWFEDLKCHIPTVTAVMKLNYFISYLQLLDSPVEIGGYQVLISVSYKFVIMVRIASGTKILQAGMQNSSANNIVYNSLILKIQQGSKSQFQSQVISCTVSLPFHGIENLIMNQWHETSSAQTISCEDPSWWTNVRHLNCSSFYSACILLTNKTFCLSDDNDQAESTHCGKKSI